MMRKQATLTVVLGLLLVTAGCVRTEPGAGVDVGFAGSMEISDSGFHASGELTKGGGVSEKQVYRNVTVYLYSEDGDLIKAKTVGDLEGRLPINISASSPPQYIIFDSPDFWKEPRIEVDYYRRTSELDRDYGIEEVTAKSEFPVQVNRSSVRNGRE